MESRQKDLQAAVAAGHLVEVARISNLLTKAAAEWQEIIQEQGAAMPSPGNSDEEIALRELLARGGLPHIECSLWGVVCDPRW